MAGEKHLPRVTELTEFPPLSSDSKPSGGFLKRFFKRNTEDPLPLSTKENVETSDTSPVTEAGPPQVVLDSPDTEVPDRGEEDNDDRVSMTSSSSAVVTSVLTAPRTLSGVLKSVSNILERRSQTPQAYKDSDFKQYWMPDNNCRQCYECGDRFNTLRRRHHCRICGQIFCSRCCNQVLPGRIMGYTGYLRVCTYCCKVVLSYAQNPEATGSLWDLSEDIRQHLLVSPDATDCQGSMTSSDLGWWELQSSLLQRRQSMADDKEYSQRLSSAVDLTASSSNPFDSARQLDYTAMDSFQEERRVLLRDSAQLRELWLLIQHPIDGIAMASHRHRLRIYPNCIVGRELVDWLLARDKATSRVQATVIGQALVDAKWLECITSSDQTFRDMYALYRAGEAVLTESPLEEPKTQTTSSEEEAEPEWFRDIKRQDEDTVSLSELNKIPSTIAAPENSDTISSSIFYIALEAESNSLEILSQTRRADIFSSMSASNPTMSTKGERFAAHNHQVAPPIRLDSGSMLFDNVWTITGCRDSAEAGYILVDSGEKSAGDSEAAVAADDIGEHYVSTEMESGSRGWLHTEELSEKNDERLAYERIIQTQKEHLTMLTTQLLGKEKLSIKWADLILFLVKRITHFIQPDLKTDGREMDIRHYVKIKKVPGSTKTHTSIVSGVVCTKNVAHKQMRQQISHASVLLLQCPIVYQRVENKFSSLEPQILQEEEFLKNCVARIAALKPDILLVGKSVSRVAQNFLLDCDITLILNVKQTVMERVSRFTHAEIVKSIDGLVSKTALGFCNLFKLQHFTLPDGRSKTLMYFDGCSPHLGCTIILRGGSVAELTKVKTVLQFMTFASYHLRLELSFLMDEFATPPPPPGEHSLGIPDIDSTTDNVSTNDAKSWPCHSTDSGTGVNSVKAETDKSSKLTSAFSEEENVCGGNVSSGESGSVDIKKTLSASCEDSAGKDTDSNRVPSDTEKEKSNSGSDLTKTKHVTDSSDPLHNYQRSKDESIFDCHAELREVGRTSRHFKDALSDVILTVSPFIKHDLPYLLTDSGAKCWLRRFFPENMFCSKRLPQTAESARGKGTAVPVPMTAGNAGDREVSLAKEHQFITQKLTSSVSDCHIQTCLADFRARGGRVLEAWSHQRPPVRDHKKINTPQKVDCLDPYVHQRLDVCFTSFSCESANAPNPCVYPWIVTMEYHGINVITLGDFLERYCFRESYTCPNESCDTSMVNHIRRFVHGRGSLQVLLKRLDLPIPGSSSNIVMWSWCRLCKQVTPVVPMSLDTWSLSFAKYLELRFYGSMYGRRASADPCPHSIHHDHYQYFGLRQIVASFKYSPISLKEISLPPVLIEIQEQDSNQPALMEAACCLATQGTNVYHSILDHLQSFRTDPNAPFMGDCIAQIQTENETFQNKIRVLLEDCDLLQGGGSSLFELQDLMVEIKRQVAEAVITWGSRIVEFEQQQRKPEKMRIVTPASRINKASTDNGSLPQVQVTETGAKTADVKQSLEDQSSLLGVTVSVPCSIGSLGENVQSGSQDQVVTGLVSSQVDKATPPKLLTGVDTGCTDRAVDSVEVDTDRLDGLADGHADRPEGSKINTVKNIFNKVLSSSGPLPITMPFAPDEHLLLQPPSENVPLIIYDQEPSSIIAYSLSCPDYSKQLEQLTQDSRDTSSRRGDLAASSGSTDSDGAKKAASSVLSFFRGATREKSPSRMTGLMGKYNVDSVKYLAKLDQDNAEENDGAMYAGPDQEGRKANKKDGPDANQHIELQFSDSSARFYCRIYFAEQFQKLRSLIFPSGEERYIRSLSRCYTWLAMGGKSGLTFCKTQDDRFILKQMSRFEVQSFMEFAPHYFEYITKAFTEKKPTALAKILGVYRIGYRNTQTNAALKQDLLVMENLFYGRDITQVFDLKGSVRNRLVNTSGKRVDELVLLDENLLKSSIDSPLYIRPHSKFILNNAINNDTHFLSSHIVMDYSLLVGLDSSRNELVVGIIDYIRTFTWDKKLEMVVKSTYSQWGGQGKMPTVVSPELYRTRFLQAMNRYFLLVPDQWTGLDTSVNLN